MHVIIGISVAIYVLSKRKKNMSAVWLQARDMLLVVVTVCLGVRKGLPEHVSVHPRFLGGLYETRLSCPLISLSILLTNWGSADTETS